MPWIIHLSSYKRWVAVSFRFFFGNNLVRTKRPVYLRFILTKSYHCYSMRLSIHNLIFMRIFHWFLSALCARKSWAHMGMGYTLNGEKHVCRSPQHSVVNSILFFSNSFFALNYMQRSPIAKKSNEFAILYVFGLTRDDFVSQMISEISTYIWLVTLFEQLWMTMNCTNEVMWRPKAWSNAIHRTDAQRH